MYLLLVAGLIVLNGLFSMSELALVSARPNRLAQRAARGDESASAARELSRHPTRFLSTVQIGITTCGILSGIFGEAVLSDPLAGELPRLGMNETQSVIIARIVVVAIVTYLSIIFGELVPKRIGQLNPEGIARVVARPMRALSFVSRPLVWLLSFTTNAILKLAGVRNENAPITQEDIFDVLQQGSRSGAIENDEQAMIRNVIRLDDRLLGSLMTHRSDVVTLDRLLPPEENIRRIREYEYTIYPVCDGGPEHLLGTLRAKDALYALMRGGQQSTGRRLRPGFTCRKP